MASGELKGSYDEKLERVMHGARPILKEGDFQAYELRSGRILVSGKDKHGAPEQVATGDRRHGQSTLTDPQQELEKPDGAW